MLQNNKTPGVFLVGGNRTDIHLPAFPPLWPKAAVITVGGTGALSNATQNLPHSDPYKRYSAASLIAIFHRHHIFQPTLFAATFMAEMLGLPYNYNINTTGFLFLTLSISYYNSVSKKPSIPIHLELIIITSRKLITRTTGVFIELSHEFLANRVKSTLMLLKLWHIFQ